LKIEFIDLINSPLSNSYLSEEQLREPETFFPLKLFICQNCFLVQIDEMKKASEIFNQDYAYFSSFSSSWLNHARLYVDMITNRFQYDGDTQVIEIASNDGYLLQYFKKKNIPVIGIEPSNSVADAAKAKGIETIIDFFTSKLATYLVSKEIKADLLIGNNVFAHVPDINDFVQGLKIILKEDGVFTLEFPHLMELIQKNQFDTIYHEHFSYFSLNTVNLIFEKYHLQIFDVEQINTHGGSLRIYGKHRDDNSKKISKNVDALIRKEEIEGMKNLDYYKDFEQKVIVEKNNLMSFLIEKNNKNKKVIAYGAAAKGNTLLNYCGIKNNLIDFVVDASPFKQGKYLPGSHIPIVKEKWIKDYKPDYILVLPWNLKSEIVPQLEYVRAWGCKFVIPIPTLEII
tara:strand:+ start:3384 stop:4583 length:1200 start_codon:yes stop_codon:yes gene_type:complete